MSPTNQIPRILIVDDSVVARRMLVGQLRELGYSDVVESASAEDALAKLHESRKGVPFSLIVADLRMPGMPGDQFVQRLQQETDFKVIPKLIASVETDRLVVLNALLCGADGYILKPTSTPVLKEKLSKIFAKEKVS
jgi:two-component system chemotaxis response regulator CheY